MALSNPCPNTKMRWAQFDTVAIRLPRPARHERGEGWGEGILICKHQASSPRPSPPPRRRGSGIHARQQQCQAAPKCEGANRPGSDCEAGSEAVAGGARSVTGFGHSEIHGVRIVKAGCKPALQCAGHATLLPETFAPREPVGPCQTRAVKLSVPARPGGVCIR